MNRNENRRVIAGAFAATALLAGLIFGTPVAHADPGDTNLGTGSAPASDNRSGTGSPAAAPSAGDGLTCWTCKSDREIRAERERQEAEK